MGENVDPKTKILTEVIAWNKQINEEKIFGDVPIISDLLYGITALVSGLGSLMITGLNYVVEIILTGAFNIIDILLLIPLSAMCEGLIEYLVTQNLIHPDIKKLLDGVINPYGNENRVLAIILYLMTSFSALTSIMEVSNVTSQQKLLNQLKPILPTPDQLVRLLFLRPEYETQWIEMLHLYGYTDDRINNMKQSAMSPLDENQIKIMYWRKLISQQEVIEKLRMIGRTEIDINNTIKTWELIPSAQDLLWMVGKEAFEPDQVNRYGLNLEFPSEQREYLEAQGITPYWQEKYWAAHWSYPSVQQVLECMHRGFISEEDVSEYYRVVEIPKFWRENLIKISYHPYTRVDVRRMHAMGVIDDEQLKKSYKDLGYDEEHAEKMRDFTIEYNKGSKDELSRAQIFDFYKLGIITEQDAFLHMEELGYERDITELFIAKTKLAIQKEYIKEVIDIAEHLYINNRINTGEVYSRLSRVQISTEKIENYIDKWEVSKQKIRKIPNKQDLGEFFTANIINENEYIKLMGENGYDRSHINYYIRLLKQGG
jgi:hypothetical protein